MQCAPSGIDTPTMHTAFANAMSNLVGQGAEAHIYLCDLSGLAFKVPSRRAGLTACMSSGCLGLQHPNILCYTALDGYSGDGRSHRWVYCMPYHGGGCLQTFLDREGCIQHMGAVRRLVKQMLVGLHFMHSHGIAHGDLKPANMLLEARTTRTGDTLGHSDLLDAAVVLIDYGGTASDLIGTPAFLSPEKAQNAMRAVPSKSDVWAAGITTLSMLNGRAPRSHMEPCAIIFHIACLQYDHILFDVGNGADEALHTFLLQCFTPEASRPSVAVLLDTDMFVSDDCCLSDNAPLRIVAPTLPEI